MFNNIWGLIVILILIFAIYKKISNLDNSDEDKKFITKYKNQLKIKEKFNVNNIIKNIPNIASYYVGIDPS